MCTHKLFLLLDEIPVRAQNLARRFARGVLSCQIVIRLQFAGLVIEAEGRVVGNDWNSVTQAHVAPNERLDAVSQLRELLCRGDNTRRQIDW